MGILAPLVSFTLAPEGEVAQILGRFRVAALYEARILCSLPRIFGGDHDQGSSLRNQGTSLRNQGTHLRSQGTSLRNHGSRA